MIKVGVIGYGKMGKLHSQVFKKLGCEIYATTNRSQKNNRIALKDGVKKSYTDYHKMINDCDLDFIILSTPFWTNFNICSDIIPYKIPILLEKPTGTSVSEHHNLIELSNEYQTLVFPAFNRRYYSIFRKVKKLIRECKNEKILSFRIEWSEQPDYLKELKGYNNDQIKKMIYGNSIHGLDLINFFIGDLNDLQVNFISTNKKNKNEYILSGRGNKNELVSFYSSSVNYFSWTIALTTNKRKFLFNPLEKCIEYKLINNKVYTNEIFSEKYDQEFKTGLYKQAQQFLNCLSKNKIPKKMSLYSATNAMNYAQKIYTTLYK